MIFEAGETVIAVGPNYELWLAEPSFKNWYYRFDRKFPGLESVGLFGGMVLGETAEGAGMRALDHAFTYLETLKNLVREAYERKPEEKQTETLNHQS